MDTKSNTANAQTESAQANKPAPAAPGSVEANAPGADEASRGQRHIDPTAQVVPVTVGSFLSAQDNTPTTHGMVLSHARKDPNRVTGVVLVKKKAYVEELMKRMAAANTPITKSAAAEAFNKYRIATYRAFSKQQGQALIEGTVNVDGAKFNKDGHAVGYTIVRASKAAQDRLAAAEETIATQAGVPRDALEAFLAKWKKENPGNADQAAIEAATTVVPETQAAGQPESVPAR